MKFPPLQSIHIKEKLNICFLKKEKPEEAAPSPAPDIPVLCSLSATLSASFSFASAQKIKQ